MIYLDTENNFYYNEKGSNSDGKPKQQVRSIWDADGDKVFSAGDVKAYIKKYYNNFDQNNLTNVLNIFKNDFAQKIKYDVKVQLVYASKIDNVIKKVTSSNQSTGSLNNFVNTPGLT